MKFTERRSSPSASISKFNNKVKGSHAETVALEHFRRQGARLICRNLPTIFSEVDLVLLSEDGEILLIEVKLVDFDELVFTGPVKKQQMLRLGRLLARWQESSDKPVRLHLAAVNHQNEVLVFEDFLS